jgi:hypothetical protein
VALRALTRHAVLIGLRVDDPTTGVRAPKFRSAGFYSWTENDIASFEAKHPIGSRVHLALALLLYTAQRRADVIHMGRQHIRDGLIHVRQRKTGATLAIPLHPELRAVLDATPTDHLTFLTTRGGRPFHADSSTHYFKRKCRVHGAPQGGQIACFGKLDCLARQGFGLTVQEGFDCQRRPVPRPPRLPGGVTALARLECRSRHLFPSCICRPTLRPAGFNDLGCMVAFRRFCMGKALGKK